MLAAIAIAAAAAAAASAGRVLMPSACLQLPPPAVFAIDLRETRDDVRAKKKGDTDREKGK